jgi:hypothetical protein
MDALTAVTQITWAISAAGVLALLSILVARRSYRAHPFFFSYLVIVLAQNAALATLYEPGENASPSYWRAAWILHAIVVAARALAAAEVCRHVLGGFRGIWVLAKRLLLSCGLAVATVYALIAILQDGRMAAISAAMGMDLAIAVVLVVLLVFARYYRVTGEPVERFVAAGLCICSCFVVINDTFFERWLQSYEPVWVILNTTVFTVIVCVWLYSFSRYTDNRPGHRAFSHLDEAVYRSFSPRINSHMRMLNEQLGKLGNVEAPPS